MLLLSLNSKEASGSFKKCAFVTNLSSQTSDCHQEFKSILLFNDENSNTLVFAVVQVYSIYVCTHILFQNEMAKHHFSLRLYCI